MGQVLPSHCTHIQDGSLPGRRWYAATVDNTTYALVVYVMKNTAVSQSHLYFPHRSHLPIYYRSISWYGVKAVTLEGTLVTVLGSSRRRLQIRFPTQIAADRFISKLLNKTALRTVTESELAFFLGSQRLKLFRRVSRLFPRPPIQYLINCSFRGEGSLETLISKVASAMIADYNGHLEKILRAFKRYGHLSDCWSDEELLANFTHLLTEKRLIVSKRGTVVPQSRYALWLNCLTTWPKSLFRYNNSSVQFDETTLRTVRINRHYSTTL